MAKVSQEQKAREAEAKTKAVTAFKAQIQELTARVPASHSSWSYQQTISYKEAMEQAKKVLQYERVTPEKCQEVLGALSLACR
ncbi:MAG: hypothetical protein RLZZ182_2130 [Pseudomonadota bacterium]|jgi:ABC-type branched-subunit amino acid transport system substrate-binding protein